MAPVKLAKEIREPKRTAEVGTYPHLTEWHGPRTLGIQTASTTCWAVSCPMPCWTRRPCPSNDRRRSARCDLQSQRPVHRDVQRGGPWVGSRNATTWRLEIPGSGCARGSSGEFDRQTRSRRLRHASALDHGKSLPVDSGRSPAVGTFERPPDCLLLHAERRPTLTLQPVHVELIEVYLIDVDPPLATGALEVFANHSLVDLKRRPAWTGEPVDHDPPPAP